MGLRGAAKWGTLALSIAVVLSAAYFTLQQAGAQGGPPGGSAANFDFYGYIKYPNGSYMEGANVTVEVVNFSQMSMGPPPTVAAFSNVTDAQGYFNISNITGGANYNVKIKRYISNYSGPDTLVAWVGPTLPPFPSFFLSNDTIGIQNSTFTLERAGNINLSAIDTDGDRVNFTFEFADRKLGFPLEDPVFNESFYIYDRVVSGPYNRNYTVQFHPFWSPPMETSVTNLSVQNDTPECYNNDTCPYILGVQINTSSTLVNVWGYINTTDFGVWGNESSNLTNLSVVGYMIFGGNMLMNGATVPSNMGMFMGGQADSINASTSTGAFYNITLPGTNTGFTTLLAFYGYANSSENPNATDLYYVGFQEVTTAHSEGDRQMNVTLDRLAGANGVISFSEFDFSKPDIVTNITTINLSSPDSDQAVGQAHMEASLTYTYANDSSLSKNYKWFLDSGQQTSQASLTVPNTTTDLKIQVFSQNFAPIKKKITNSLLNTNSTLLIPLYQMDLIDPDQHSRGSGGLKASVQMDFYTSSAACDVPLPAPSCVAASFGSAGEFNPMKAMLGGAVSLRMTQSTGVSVHYVNVDLLASGPPDAAMGSDTSINGTAGTSFDEIWKFGSTGPDIYDYVLIGIPYTDNPGDLNDSSEVNMSIPIFYDDDWNVIWNVSSNTSNANLLAGNNSDYSDWSPHWQILMNNNTCVTNVTIFNSTNPCYINSTANRVWIRIPHFSGTGPSITGSVVDTPDTVGGGTTTTGGGGGGGGATTNTGTKYIKLWSVLGSGALQTVEISKEQIGFTEVRFTVSKEVSNAKLVVEKLSERPSALLAPAKKAFQYLEISTENFNDSDIEGTPRIKFKVNNTWLEQNGLDMDKVVLLRYTAQWDELPAARVSRDANYTWYEVSVPGFSTFAIVAGALEAEEPSGPVCGDGTCDPGESPSSCPVDCKAAEKLCEPGQRKCEGNALAECAADGSSYAVVAECGNGCDPAALSCIAAPQTTQPQMELLWAGIVAVVVIVAGAGFFYTRKRKKGK